MYKANTMRRLLGAGATIATLALTAAIVAAAPPVEEELPGGKTSKAKALTSPKASAPSRQGVATGAGATAGAVKAAGSDGIVIEGEAVQAKASRGDVRAEDMSGFGTGWSGGRQLRWSAPGQGAMLTLAPDVPAGSYQVTLHLTQGPAYARIEAIGTQGVIPRSDVELYGPAIAPPAQVSLGVLELGPERGFALRITGRDPRATGYNVGIDRITLSPAPPGAATAPAAR